MEPSLSGSSVVTQHGHGSMTEMIAAKQSGRSAPQHADDQLQVQMQHCTQAGDVSPGSSGKGRDVGLQRLTAALTAVLSSGMASDFVEGLKPVLHNGKLAISTFIKLDHDPEPVFIGMFPSLPAAVAAQKQSSELIGQLPPGVARKLITQQLAHTDPTAGPQGATQQQCQAGGPHAPPERWQSNTTSDSTAVGTGSSSQAAEGDGTPKAAQQKQQQDHSSRDRQYGQSAQGPQAAGQQQQGVTQSPAAAIHSTLAAAAAAAAAAGGQSALTPRSIAAAVASPSPRSGGALTDNMIRMLLNKGLHALNVAQQQQHPHGHQQGEHDSGWQLQQDLLHHQLPPDAEQSLLDIFNTPVSTPGSGTALAEALQLLPSPGQSQQQQQQQRHAALMQQLAASPMDSQRLLSSLHSTLRDPQGAPGMGGPPTSSQQQQYAPQASQYPTSMGNAAAGDFSSSLPPLLSLVSQGPAGAMPHGGDIGLALDGALENAMLRGAGGPWGSVSAAMSLPMAYSQAPEAAYTAAGFASGVPEQLAMAGFQQQQQGYGGYGGAGMEYGMGAYAGGGYNLKQEDLGALGMGMREMQEMQFPGAAAYAGADFDDARGMAAAAAAAAAAAGGDGEGVGDKRKRVAADPRVNCVKSVQYRVSRFPSELHDLCIEHWERARCARVVCNDIQGVMSVQNGRCVVTFKQNNQEVVKGVADYLRYAGEERIKKWRRHVRMVDFPRPGNRSGELMTAEEFLCIVGYQSEQGGKRARGDYD